MEEKLVKCFGDEQVKDGGWHACYDGKWIDITNDVAALVALFAEEQEKLKRESYTKGWRNAFKEMHDTTDWQSKSLIDGPCDCDDFTNPSNNTNSSETEFSGGEDE